MRELALSLALILSHGLRYVLHMLRHIHLLIHLLLHTGGLFRSHLVDFLHLPLTLLLVYVLLESATAGGTRSNGDLLYRGFWQMLCLQIPLQGGVHIEVQTEPVRGVIVRSCSRVNSNPTRKETIKDMKLTSERQCWREVGSGRRIANPGV